MNHKKKISSILIITASFVLLAAITFFVGIHLNKEIGIKHKLKKVEQDWQSLDYSMDS